MSSKQKSANTDDIISKIKELESETHGSKEKLNNIPVLIDYLASPNDPVVFHALRALQRLFFKKAEEGFLSLDNVATSQVKKTKTDLDAKEKVMAWMQKQYQSFLNGLYKLLQRDEPGIQVPALEAIMSFVQKDTEAVAKRSGKPQIFRNTIFVELVSRLVLNPNFNEVLLDAWREKYLYKYDDVRYFALINIKKLIKNRLAQSKKDGSGDKSKLTDDQFCTTVYLLITDMRMPTTQVDVDGFFCGKPDLKYVKQQQKQKQKSPGKNTDNQKKRKREEKTENADSYAFVATKLADIHEHKKVFTKCWLEFLSMRLPLSTYKQVLTQMHDQILPYITTPALLMDFLSSAYEVGGVVSLLALNGLFLLMSKHNLDYPDFYNKLYQLFQPEVFYMKYRARFFKLAQVFLSSSHLPNYLVCAFAKRMARLALFAPPSAVTALLPMIYNILVDHAGSHVLIHRTKNLDLENQILMLDVFEGDIVKQDPFNFEETDPEKSGALDSSLWEVIAMKNHYSPSVATLANIFDFPNAMIRKQKYELDEFVDQSYQSMIEFEMRRKNRTGFPLAFTKPTSLFEETGFKAWNLYPHGKLTAKKVAAGKDAATEGMLTVE